MFTSTKDFISAVKSTFHLFIVFMMKFMTLLDILYFETVNDPAMQNHIKWLF